MRALIIGIAVSTAVYGVAVAEGAKTPQAGENTSEAERSRSVYVCDSDQLTRRSFSRTHGKIEFVRPADAVKSQAEWDAPKCIRKSDLAKLKRMQLASVGK